MRKFQRDFAVNTVAFVLFVGLATTGLVMRFRLPKGSGESLALWGLGRHDWGGVHFWVAVAMLAVIALHLFLNWGWIVAVVRGHPRERGVGARVGAGLFAVGALFALATAMFLSPVRETGAPAEHEMERSEVGGPAAAGCTPTPNAEVHGTMSLDDVARTTGAPAEHLIRQLRLPADVPRNRPLRELTGAHGFTMDDVRRVVADYLRRC